jgi:hypothetical protein
MSDERERELLDRIDEELRDALSVTPSPELLPRIRLAVESSQAPSWSFAWFVPVAAGAAALAVAAWLLARSPVERPALEARGEQPPVSAPPPQAVAPPPAVPAKAAAVRRPPEPEILVPPGQEAELRRLVAALRTGKLDATALLADEPAPAQDLVVAPLGELAPLEVKPLASGIDTEGVDR